MKKEKKVYIKPVSSFPKAIIQKGVQPLFPQISEWHYSPKLLFPIDYMYTGANQSNLLH